MEEIQFFEKFADSRFMVCIRTPRNLTSETTVVLVHGFWSLPLGRKYDLLSNICERLGVKCAAYELIGHGSDIARLDNMDLNVLIGQLEDLIPRVFGNDVILIGSCGGGLVALQTARKHPTAVKGIITLASALDWRFLTPEQMKTVNEKGFVYVRFGHHVEDCKITKRFCDSYAEVEHWAPHEVSYPVHIIQGSGDNVMDWRKSLKLLEFVQGKDVMLKVIQGTGHRVADKKSFREIEFSLQTMLGK